MSIRRYIVASSPTGKGWIIYDREWRVWLGCNGISIAPCFIPFETRKSARFAAKMWNENKF